MEEIKKIELSNRLFKLIVILVVAMVITYVVGWVVSIKNLPNNYPRELTVSSEGKIYVIPDIATVNITVSNEGNESKDIPAIISENAEKMNAIINAIKTLGIDEKDIKTTNYDLSPQYNWTKDQGNIFIGYRITNTILVKIRDFKKIGDVLTKANNNGASSIGNISFTIEDPEKVTQEARDKAIQQAKEKAKNIAKSAGIRLGKLLAIQEGSSNGVYPMYEKASGLGGANAAPVAPEIQPGQNEVSVTVSLTYRIK